MKNFKKLLLFLLIVPICFGFSACKKKKNDDVDSNPPSTEQNPNGGNNNDGGGSENPTPNAGAYSVFYDYNLPEDYDFLLNDYSQMVNVGTDTVLSNNISGNLGKYFLGWSKNGESEILNSITGSNNESIFLKGNWDEENLRNFYYSDGLVIEPISSSSSGKVISYSGSSKIVIVPKYIKNEQYNYQITEICDSVFEDKNVEKIIINSDALVIGNNAFKNTNLSIIDFSKITKIGNNAFENTNLSSVVLKLGVSSIGSRAFKNCLNLAGFNFNNNTLEILDETFYGCSALRDVINASNIISFGELSFAECALINDTFFGNNCTFIGENAFKNCSGLVNVNIPSSVVSLGDNVFEGCENIVNLTLGRLYVSSDNDTRNDNLISHLWGKVYNENKDVYENINIESVTKITITGNTTKLYKNYFLGFVNLNTFEMPDSVTEIEENTFYSCSNLKTIRLSNSIDIDKFSYLAFKGTKYLSELNEPLILNNSVIVFAPQNLSQEYKNYVVPGNIIKITKSAFNGNNTLETIKFHSNMTLLADGAFSSCKNLTSVEFESNSNITKISKQLFYNCIKLTSVNLTNLTNLTVIDDEAFAYTKISEFEIPTTVTQINKNVFWGADITKFVINGTSEKYKVVDDVLYEIYTETDSETSVTSTKMKLLSYPVSKSGEFFICPDDVTEFLSYSFYSVKNLKYIFFRNESIEWGTTPNGSEPPCNNIFDSYVSFICLKDKSGFIYNERQMNYYSYISTGVDYDYVEKKPIIGSDLSADTQEGLYFIGFADSENNNKISIAIFELEKVGETGSESLQIKANSTKIFKTELTELFPE